MEVRRRAAATLVWIIADLCGLAACAGAVSKLRYVGAHALVVFFLLPVFFSVSSHTAVHSCHALRMEGMFRQDHQKAQVRDVNSVNERRDKRASDVRQCVSVLSIDRPSARPSRDIKHG